MSRATRDQAPGGDDRLEPATEPAFMRLVEEDRGSPVGFRTRRPADTPELTEVAIALGNPGTVSKEARPYTASHLADHLSAQRRR